MSHRLRRAGTVTALCASALVPGAQAQAGTTYSAPLRTAVRELQTAPEDQAPYDRERSFGGVWLDRDGDCHDTRSEVLLTESRVAASGGCVINDGRWVSWFDASTYSSARAVQIDHLVPVAEAWDSGARLWSQARRVAFYNDLGDGRTLNVMTSDLNQSKQAFGPEEWLPPRASVRCRYIAEWVAVKHRWSMRVDPVERAALVREAASCPDLRISVRKA